MYRTAFRLSSNLSSFSSSRFSSSSFRLLSSRSFSSSSPLPPPSSSSIPSPPKKNGIRWGRLIGGGLLGGLMIGGGSFIYKYSTDNDFHERVERLRIFWGSMFPIWIHYRYTQLFMKIKSASIEENDAAFDDLHQHYAPIALNLIHRLRGFYIKIGQIGSTRNDFVPKEYLTVLTTLQDGVPPLPGSWARERIEKELGKSIDELFLEFNDNAIGAATIGQAHEARLKDGRSVIIKIQYPEVEKLFGLDMATVKQFTALAQPEHLPVFDEMEKQFMTEFDFIREANHLKLIRKPLLEKFDGVDMPEPIDGMVTRHILTMTRCPGIKVVDSLKIQMESIAKKKGIPVEELKKQYMDKQDSLRKAGIKLKPHPHWQIKLYKKYLHIKDFFINIMIGIINGITRKNIPYQHSIEPIDAIDLIDRLNALHAYQVFQIGSFNGDPHPGNILLSDDGIISLIDFGQVKTLSEDERYCLALLFNALANNDKELIYQLYTSMGFKTKKMDRYVITKAATILFDRDDAEVCEGMNIQFFLEYLNKLDINTAFPDQYLMAGRAAMLLRGLGTWLSYEHSSAKAWLPYAKDFIQYYEKKYNINKNKNSIAVSS